jgi:hypothetical protein
MSEQLTSAPEQHKADRAETLLTLPTPEKAEPLRKGEADPAKALREARARVAETTRAEVQPNPLETLKAAEEASQNPAPRRIDRALKQITLRRELQQIRRQLPRPARAFSQVIHQPAVRAISEAAGRTVSRPSGLLGGGLLAFTGTSIYLYLARHIGFTYNYLVFLLLLAGGFVLGLLAELAVHLILSSRRAH